MIVAGFGFRSGATLDSLASALAALGEAGDPAVIATAADKAETALFKGFAERLGLPVLPISAKLLQDQATGTQSAPSQAARGTGSVAEAAALAGAGKGAILIAARVVSDDRMATCALASGEDT